MELLLTKKHDLHTSAQTNWQKICKSITSVSAPHHQNPLNNFQAQNVKPDVVNKTYNTTCFVFNTIEAGAASVTE